MKACSEVVYLLCIALGVRQLGGHVEHDLFVAVVAVDGLGARLSVRDVQPSAESAGEEREGRPGAPGVGGERRGVSGGNSGTHTTAQCEVNVEADSGPTFPSRLELNPPHPLKSCRSIFSPRNSRNSTKAGLSFVLLKSSSSVVCDGKRDTGKCFLLIGFG